MSPPTGHRRSGSNFPNDEVHVILESARSMTSISFALPPMNQSMPDCREK